MCNSIIFDNGTNVGIGTASPLIKTHISATNNGALELLRLENSDVNGRQSIIGFKNAGLGNPTTKIYGGGVTAGGDGTFKVVLTNPSGTDQTIIEATNSSGTDPKIVFSTAGSERVRIDYTGNVGIGTINPSYLFHVKSSSGTISALEGTVASLRLVGTSSLWDIKSNGSFTNDFVIRDVNTGKDRLNLKANGDIVMAWEAGGGNVGIGTTAPQTLLHLTRPAGGNGNLIVEGNSSVTGAPKMYLIDITGATVTTAPSWMISNTADKMSISRALTLGGVYADLINITNTGSVGIGTTSPSTQLHTTGGVRFQTLTGTGNRFVVADLNGNISTASATTAGIVTGSGTLNYLPKWSPDGATLANSQLFDNGTNVGIGTVTPAAKLDVGGNSQSSPRVSARSSGIPGFEFGHVNQAGYGSTLGATEPNGSPYLAFNAESEIAGNTFKTRGIMGRVISANLTGGILFSRAINVNAGGQTLTNDMIIDGSGNVGIGTITPTAKLHISQATGSALKFDNRQLIIFNQNTNPDTTGNIIGGLGFYGFSITHGQFHYRTGKGFEMIDVSPDAPNIAHASTTFAPLYLSSLYTTGNVGIGTTVPTIKLSITGATNGESVGFEPYTYFSSAYSTANASISHMVKTNVGVVGYNKSTGITTSSSLIEVGDAITFATKASDTDIVGTAWDLTTNTKMVITNTGNVGIGTASPTSKLVVDNGTSADASLVLQNSISDGSNIRFKNSGTNAFSIDQIEAPNARLRIFTESGPSGNVERLTILETGNIGIGVTTPTSTLDVNGTISGNYQGFSYYASGATAPTAWNAVVIPTLDYNTFGGGTYNTGTGLFTAPKAGYYRFMLGGYTTANTTTNDRYAIGISVNGILRAFGGGQFSSADSPEGTFTHVVHLNAGDLVQPMFFNSLGTAINLGAASAGHQFWFQGEFIGK
jgi:hypothetical protein